MDIIVREKIFIPVEMIKEKDVKKRYVHRFYDENACRRCENRPERHNYLCNKCEFYKGTTVTYDEKTSGNRHYFGLPLGDRENIEEVFDLDFDDFNVVDARCVKKRKYDVQMVGLTPYDYQATAIKDLRRSKYGILKAPPRSGKTPTMLYTGITQFPYKVVMIADQREFLNQFLDHAIEFTNIRELEEKYGKKLCGYAKTKEEFQDFEIAVCTYQSFLSVKGKKLLKYLNANFGTVFIDEVHSASAEKYSEIINLLQSKIRIGATGTDDRKDGRIKIIKQIVGDVTALIKIPQLQPIMYVHPIDFVKSKNKFTGRAGFTRLVGFLSEHKKRNELIIEWVMKDLAKGHSIVIPVYRKEHVSILVKLINDEYGKKIAGGFEGGASKIVKIQRAASLEEAKSGKLRVIVGIRSLLQRGLNVPRWSMLYNVMPINNAPNWHQESSRILTPMDNKRQPAIRFFVDENIGMPLGCFVSTYKQSIKLSHKPTDTARERAKALMKKHGSKTRTEHFDEDDGTVFKSKSPKGATGFNLFGK